MLSKVYSWKLSSRQGMPKLCYMQLVTPSAVAIAVSTEMAIWRMVLHVSLEKNVFFIVMKLRLVMN